MAESAGRPELLLHPLLHPDELLAELQGRLQAVLATRDRMRGLLRLLIDDPAGRPLWVRALRRPVLWLRARSE
jgi:hypothetical protein